MKEVLISVIIPTYNRRDLIVKTIESLLMQSYSNFEVIVVDDGSTDNTEEHIRKLTSKHIKYFKTKNQERGAARNYGVDQSNGDYVVFLDSDDKMLSHCLASANEFIHHNNNPEVFHLAHEVLSERGELLETTTKIKNINHVLIKGNPLACINVFLRRDIALKFRFNTNRLLSGFEDWELWLRVASNFEIKQSNIVCGHMLDHIDRGSHQQLDKSKLINKIDLLMNLVLKNSDIVVHYLNQLHLFKSSCYTYVSLHLSIMKNNKILAISYLLKGLKLNPKFIFKKRFFAILKHMIFR